MAPDKMLKLQAPPPEPNRPLSTVLYQMAVSHKETLGNYFRGFLGAGSLAAVPEKRKTSREITTPFRMPQNTKQLRRVMDRVLARSDINEKVRTALMHDILRNFCSSLAIGRPCGRVTILLFGLTGQGKSRTINKLVGAELLRTGSDESTTKVIQRVSVSAVKHGIDVELAFDDTPGLDDTTVADRVNNAVLFSRYCESFSTVSTKAEVERLMALLREVGCEEFIPTVRSSLRTSAYPNAILLTATWDTIKPDHQNPPEHFVTPMGKAMWALRSSELYDRERPNVVIVVTKSLSFYHTDYEGESKEDADRMWREDAKKKEGFIRKICAKVFGAHLEWPIVFVENGSRKTQSTYRQLPNGQQSHRNLFDALRTLFNQNTGAGVDIQGLHALVRVGKGVKITDGSPPEPKTVAGLAPGEVVSTREKDMALRRIGTRQDSSGSVITAESSAAVAALAREIIGCTYNPLTGRLGTSPIFENLECRTTKSSSRQFERISRMSGEYVDHQSHLLQLGISFEVKLVADAKLHGQKAGTSHVASSQQATCFQASKVIAKAALQNITPQLSPEMIAVVNRLPPWNGGVDEEVRRRYEEFFDDHGTHYVKSGALGGIIKLESSGESALREAEVNNRLQAGASGAYNFMTGGSGETNGRKEGSKQGRSNATRISFDREGGERAGVVVQSALEDLFNGPVPTPAAVEAWKTARTQWIDALFDDPMFLIRDKETTFAWLSTAGGISDEQRASIRSASRWYLEAVHNSSPTSRHAQEASSASVGSNEVLDRQNMGKLASTDLRDGIQWWDAAWGMLREVWEKIIGKNNSRAVVGPIPRA